MYYTMTTLTTVGFGDVVPRSDTERVVTSMVLLFGVAIFSYILGVFIDITGSIDTLNADIDEGDQLTMFFGMLKKFNNNKPLDFEIQKSIEEYFLFKW